MNYRPVLIALALTCPLAAYAAPAPLDQSWQPVALTKTKLTPRYTTSNPNNEGEAVAVRAYARYVLIEAGTFNFYDKAYDLQTGKVQDLFAFAETGGGWRVPSEQTGPLAGTLEVHPEGRPDARLYRLPADVEKVTGPMHNGFQLSRERNCVEYASGNYFCRWDLISGHLLLAVALSPQLNIPKEELVLGVMISRDGETLTLRGGKDIYFVATRTGQLKRRVPVILPAPPNQSYLSPFGAHVIYKVIPDDLLLGDSYPYVVVDTQSGKVKWSFKMNNYSDVPTFSSDGSLVVYPLVKRRVWEIRDATTGELIRTLPLVSGAHLGAFSPDGATLYSVADGVLYRQRAR